MGSLLSFTEPDAAATASRTSWHACPAREVLDRLGSDRDGLTEEDARQRLARAGPNIFRAAPPVSVWRVFLSQFRSVLVVLLVVAAGIAAATGDPGDAVAIGAVLVLNVAIGFTTELRAHRAMEALQRLEVSTARVVRGGRSRTVDARELVPGDVLLVEAGQTVPADARLLESAELTAVETPLTGEPDAVPKRAEAAPPVEAPLAERPTMIYKTTIVVTGTARAVVVETGMATEVGRIGELVGRVAKAPTPLERRLDALGRRLALLAVGVAVVAVVLGAWQGEPIGRLLQTAIALAVAAVPEGLPVVGTIAMAVGVRRMARRRALIRHLPVVEALGSASVICTDKTGTLTAGRMTATVIRLGDQEVTVSGAGLEAVGEFRGRGRRVDPQHDKVLARVVQTAVLATAAELHHADGAWHAIGDPTDVALLVLGQKAGLSRDAMIAEWPEAGQLPFSSERRLMASYHHRQGALVAHVKGAPPAVLQRCGRIAEGNAARPLLPAERDMLLREDRELAARGLRMLGIATGTVGRPTEEALTDLTWLGLIGLSDPPAEGVRESVRAFREAGIRTVMITGDNQLTATSLARELGMAHGGQAVLTRDIEGVSDEELEGLATRVSVYGRASPESKLRIVAALQRRGETVAMLGDGVNDAAALRKADIGVAMGGRGSDVAKEAADVILEDDRFLTIGVAIEEGRVILANVRKFVAYLFSCNLAEILVLLGASVAGYPTALAPLQILWLNLVTDTLPALALAVEPGDPGIMRRRPTETRASLLGGTALVAAAGYAVLITLVALAAFAVGARRGDLALAGTLTFMTLGFAQVFHLGNARSTTPVLGLRRIVANRFALGAALLALGLQGLAAGFAPLARTLHVAPLGPIDWLVVVALGAAPAVIGQGLKLLRGARA
jgi:P-type Ca2+ transporter type 2C